MGGSLLKKLAVLPPDLGFAFRSPRILQRMGFCEFVPTEQTHFFLTRMEESLYASTT